MLFSNEFQHHAIETYYDISLPHLQLTKIIKRSRTQIDSLADGPAASECLHFEFFFCKEKSPLPQPIWLRIFKFFF